MSGDATFLPPSEYAPGLGQPTKLVSKVEPHDGGGGCTAAADKPEETKNGILLNPAHTSELKAAICIFFCLMQMFLFWGRGFGGWDRSLKEE